MAESNGIQVVVRLRPVNAQEKREGTPPVVSSNTAESTVTLVRAAGKGSSAQSRSTFKADNVFGSFSTQEEVFDQTMPGILKDVLKGFESTVFAYGQTGTGKTHTMEGQIDNPEQRGIIPRAAASIFASLQDDAFIEKAVSVSYLEIYNQDLNDLLVKEGADKTALRIVEGAGNAGETCLLPATCCARRADRLYLCSFQFPTGVYCHGLSRQTVLSPVNMYCCCCVCECARVRAHVCVPVCARVHVECVCMCLCASVLYPRVTHMLTGAGRISGRCCSNLDGCTETSLCWRDEDEQVIQSQSLHLHNSG